MMRIFSGACHVLRLRNCWCVGIGRFAAGFAATAAVCAIGFATLVNSAGPAAADRSADSWVREIPGFGNFGRAPKVDAAAARKEREVRRAELSVLPPPSLELSEQAELALKLAVEQYQMIVANGGWPALPRGPKLQLGMRDERVETLRRILAINGDWVGRTQYPWMFDESLAQGLRQFQLRHGLAPTGEVDRPTFATLNIPADQKLTQLRINLIRFSDLMKAGMPERYVLVNIPAYELQAIDPGRVALHSKVVVGRPEAPTPAIRAQIKGMNFFPYWHVPESIAHRDLIPLLAKDPGYLQKQHIRLLKTYKGEEVPTDLIDWRNPPPEVMGYKFQQDPGDWNALGLVRIDMPNEHIVYMHDTPLKDLFVRPARPFSAGCVRVEKVLDLVAWLASFNGDWDRARVDSVLAGGVPMDVSLVNPIEVQFVYLTAWAGKGVVHFREDIYSRDGVNLLLANYDAEDVPAQGLAP